MTDREQFQTIEDMVKYLETEYDITVMSIRDYGSRVWNLDSETSDMDAGMVFRQDPINYIELGGYRQNIDRKFMLDGEEFELIGWNIKRFSELLNKSNPSMIEWLNSDIVYYETWTRTTGGRISKLEENSIFFNDLKKHANKQFKPISLFYHYRSMAKQNFNKYIESGNDIRVKRHLYILRGLTYARYVEETHEMPPLDYQQFYNEELPELVGENEFMPEWIYQQLGEFINLKTSGKGDRQHGDEELWNWIREELDTELDNEQHDVRGINREKVNNFIKRAVPR